jgi:hypothetical protein
MAALSENRSVRQRPDEGFRRWFLNDYFDLILWYESRAGEMTGFQLCYDRHRDERAFTWERGKQSSHFVSSGSDERGRPWIATAVLHGDAGPVPAEVVERLERESGELDPEILAVILDRIGTYNDRRAPS